MTHKHITALFALCFLCFFPTLSFATTLDEALDKATLYFTATHVKLQPQQEFVLEVTNYRSGKKDSQAIKIESELYLALEKNFPQFKLLLASESLSGISVSRAVYMKVTYDPRGEKTTLRLQAIKGMNGEILAETSVQYDSKITLQRSLVAVLDLEGEDLSKKQRRAYSEIFRSQLIQSTAFNVASSAEVDKLDPDAIQEQLQCTRDECAAIIGEQLGVDRVISASIFKLSDQEWVFAAKILNIRDSSILTSVTVNHNGDSRSFTQALQQLTTKLTGKKLKRSPVLTAKYGKLFVSTIPKGANIILDNRKYAINFALKSIPSNAKVFIDRIYRGKTPLSLSLKAGRHQLKITRKGYGDRQQSITLNSRNRNTRLNIQLKRIVNLKVTITPGNAELSVDNKRIPNPNPAASIESTEHYTLQLPEGSHSISIKHPHAVQNLQKNIRLSARNLTVSQNYTLKIDPDYLNQLAYKNEMEIWNFKWISSVTLALATTAYAVTERQKAQKASDNMNAEFTAMSQSPIYSESQVHNQNALKHKKAVEQHNANVQTGSMLSAALWGLATWMWMDEPQQPKRNSLSFLPVLESKSIQLVWKQRW